MIKDFSFMNYMLDENRDIPEEIANGKDENGEYIYGDMNILNHLYNIKALEIIDALKNHKSIRAALFSLKMSDASANYIRIRNLLDKNPEIEIGQNLPIIEQKNTKEKHCPNCGKLILQTSNLCVECSQIAQRVVDRPNREELKNLIRSTSFLQIGKQFNVSDTAIRKWCDSYNLPRKKSIIKSYTDEEWQKI